MTTAKKDGTPARGPRPSASAHSGKTNASVSRQRATREQPPAADYVTIAAAAKRWGVSIDTIRRLITAGKVTGYRLNNRIVRVAMAEVDACFMPIPVGYGKK